MVVFSVEAGGGDDVVVAAAVVRRLDLLWVNGTPVVPALNVAARRGRVCGVHALPAEHEAARARNVSLAPRTRATARRLR